MGLRACQMNHAVPNEAFENWIAHTPPMCLHRLALWRTCRHFLENVRGPGRAGAEILFRNDASIGVAIRTHTVGFSPKLLTRTNGK